MNIISILALILSMWGAAGAVTPVIWKRDTQAAFAGGEASGVSITREGEVRLGPTLEVFADTGEDFVWSVARDGETIYAGTGGGGRVYRMRGGTTELLFDSPERGIFSLAVGGNGTVYAGSSPGGLIYAIPKRGEPRTFARTGDDHVWVLIPDGNGGLLAATGGGHGRVVRVSGSGDVTEVLKASDPNVSALIRAKDGTLYAGTDQSGLIYRVGPGGDVDVLYDAAEEQISALAIARDGRLLAGAMNSSRPTKPRPPSQNNGHNNGNGSGEKSAVYAVRPSGSGWRLWDVPAASVHALSVRSDGSVTVVTGGRGEIYRLFQDGSHSVVTTVEEAQPWAFLADGAGGGWIASSGGGQVFRLGSGSSREGQLTSKPEDFGLVTEWGRIGWDGETPNDTEVVFETRTGNSGTPDRTWSGWSTVGADGAVSMRPARYAQVRLTLRGDGKVSPTVREVTLSGLPENVQPLIADLSVRGPHEGSDGGQGNGNSGGGRQGASSPKAEDGWVISWTAADVNNDSLTYTLHFKGRAERMWKLLAEDLTGNSYTWNTESAPEGTVQVRVTASDAASNPRGRALTATRISAPFNVDHTEPVVRIASVTADGRRVSVTGSMADASSYLRSGSYSLNSGPWQVMFPDDRVFDSAKETISLSLPDLDAGEYTIVIRAEDGHGNVGVAKQVFEVE